MLIFMKEERLKTWCAKDKVYARYFGYQEMVHAQFSGKSENKFHPVSRPTQRVLDLRDQLSRHLIPRSRLRCPRAPTETYPRRVVAQWILAETAIAPPSVLRHFEACPPRPSLSPRSTSGSYESLLHNAP